MRFKPRTDLERIFYEVNSYSVGKISKKIVNEYLEKLNLNTFKKIDEEDSQKLKVDDLFDNDKILDDEEIQELLKQKEFLNKQGFDEKNSETLKQIEVILLNYNNKNNNSNSNNNNNNNSNNNKVKLGDSNSNTNYINKNIQKNNNNINIKNSAIRKFNKNFDLNSKTFFKAASVYSFKLHDYKKNLKVNEIKNPKNDPYYKKILKENNDKLSTFNSTFVDYKFNINNNIINNTNNSKFDLTVFIKGNDNNNSDKNEEQSCFIEFDKIEPHKTETEENFFRENVYEYNTLNNNNNKKKHLKHQKNISNLNLNNYDNDNNNKDKDINYDKDIQDNNNKLFNFFNNNPNNSSNMLHLNNKTNNNYNDNNLQEKENNSNLLYKEKLLYLKRISASSNLAIRGENNSISIDKKEPINEIFSSYLNTKYNNNKNEDFNNLNSYNKNNDTYNLNITNNNNKNKFSEKRAWSKSVFDNNIDINILKNSMIKEEENKKSKIYLMEKYF
jgi:hypothetical protein